jgi:hypothetical protein
LLGSGSQWWRFSFLCIPEVSPASATTTATPDKSKSELLYDWRFTVYQFVLAPSPLRPTTREFFNCTLVVIVIKLLVLIV